MPVSAVCIFCEDIRQEQSGQDTLVGTLPDTLEINALPINFPKFAIYLRVHLDVDHQPREISARVLNTNESEISAATWDQTLLDTAFAGSRANQLPIVGLIFKVLVSPLNITSAGNIVATATIDGIDYVAGSLRVTLGKARSGSADETLPRGNPNAAQ